MFHKITKHNFRQTLRKLENHIQTGYHHVKQIGNNIDYGVSVAKHIQNP